jgi:NAD(P)H-flavin reductase
MPIQEFTAAVCRVHDLTHDVREIDLRLIEPQEIDFKAGQFISFDVRPPGSQRSVVRPYSIASPPTQSKVITLLFNLVPGGPGSTFLFGLTEGQQVRFKGVAGSFYLRDDPHRDVLFVATGTGIAPIRSMLLDLLGRRTDRSVRLFWGVRTQRDLYYQEELQQLVRLHRNFTFVMTLSRPAEGWTGEIGRVTHLVRDRISTVADLSVYLCGNGSMIKDVTAILHGKGLCPIYREKYYDDQPDHPED